MTKVNLAEMVGARQVTKGNKAKGLKMMSMEQLRKLAMNHISEANKIGLQQKKKIARKNLAEMIFATNSGKNYIKKAHPEYFNQPKPVKKASSKKATSSGNNNVPAEFKRLLENAGVVTAPAPLNLLATTPVKSWASNAENNNNSNYGGKRSNRSNNSNNEREQEGYDSEGENQPIVYIPVRESRRKMLDPRKGKAVGSMGRKVRRGMKKGGLTQANAMNKAMQIVALGKAKTRKSGNQRVTVTVPQARLPLMHMGSGNMRRPTVPTRGLTISKYATSLPIPTLRRIRRATENRPNNRTKMLENELRVQRALKSAGLLNNNVAEVLKMPTSFTLSRMPPRGAMAALAKKPVGNLTAPQRKMLSIMGKMKKN
jgi:hypothetical protein